MQKQRFDPPFQSKWVRAFPKVGSAYLHPKTRQPLWTSYNWWFFGYHAIGKTRTILAVNRWTFDVFDTGTEERHDLMKSDWTRIGETELLKKLDEYAKNASPLDVAFGWRFFEDPILGECGTVKALRGHEWYDTHEPEVPDFI